VIDFEDAVVSVLAATSVLPSLFVAMFLNRVIDDYVLVLDYSFIAYLSNAEATAAHHDSSASSYSNFIQHL
jgi:hypothetical protein